jgi:Aminotransferase class-III
MTEAMLMPPELLTIAEGCWICTRDGRRILDFTGGVGVLNHGHNHPRILAVRKKFAEQRRMEVHKTYFSPYVAALSHNLAQLLPGDLSMSFFPNSGALPQLRRGGGRVGGQARVPVSRRAAAADPARRHQLPRPAARAGSLTGADHEGNGCRAYRPYFSISPFSCV